VRRACYIAHPVAPIAPFVITVSSALIIIAPGLDNALAKYVYPFSDCLAQFVVLIGLAVGCDCVLNSNDSDINIMI
jgi:hypothetical protein